MVILQKLFVRLPPVFCVMVVLLFSGCTKVRYSKSIHIQAPFEDVFAVLEDYEKYPEFIPEFHDMVTVISEIKKGAGVVFENVSRWNKHTMKSEYEVTGYEKNSSIEMKNNSHYGFTQLKIEKMDEQSTRYTMTNEFEIPKSMESTLFSAFDTELQLVKK